MDTTPMEGDGLTAARAREAALREVLQVIARSRDDEQPVFEAIIENAHNLCEAKMAAFVMGEEGGGPQVMVANRGATEETLQIYRDGHFPMDPEISTAARAIIERKTVHLHDMADTDLYRQGHPNFVSLVDQQGIRTNLLVPLISQGQGIGCLILFRDEVRPYSDDQIALVEAFAAQAVIAIENVRQFRELQARLEREKATREILEVISRSRDDDMPVFEAIMDSARRLCCAETVSLVLANPERTHVVRVAYSGGPDRLTIGERFSLEDTDLGAVRAFRDGRALHRPDLLAAEQTEGIRVLVEEGVRTLIWVPLLGRGGSVGCLGLFRHEQRPFDDDEIALAEAFAAQAVIAIENVRQFRELQTRLEREKASAEILEVIGRSRDDEGPVFDVILKNALRLCDVDRAVLCIANAARTEVFLTAVAGLMFTEFRVGVDSWPMHSQQNLVRAVAEKRMIHTPDMRDTDLYRAGDETRVAVVDQEGLRTQLALPLMQRGEAIGSLIFYRRKVLPFDDADIALLETFAAQAVIAIENVRQFRALEARTEEVQTLNAGLEARVEAQVGEIERMGKLKRFLPAAVADAVVSSGSDAMLKSHRSLLGILFCDIRGFTAFCETAEPEETMAVLQTYHQEMGKLIADHGAGVDHRMGDGIMVLFNDPLPCEDPAGDAVRLAMAMRARMAELCAEWKKLGHRLGFGVGISLGYATVGMVGYEGRSDYTASGTAVNLAARLCDKAEDGEILLSPRAAIAVEDDVVSEPGGVLELKGLAAPVAVTRAVAMR